MKKNPFALLRTGLDSLRLLWRLGLRRLGLVPLTFDPRHKVDRRLEVLLLFWRYGRRLSTLEASQFGWAENAQKMWVFLVPGSLDDIRQDPDLPHVRRGHAGSPPPAETRQEIAATGPASPAWLGSRPPDSEDRQLHCPNCRHRVLKIQPGRRCPYCQRPFPVS